jgi:hypothetical protein
MMRKLRTVDSSFGLAVENGAAIVLLLFLAVALVIGLTYETLAITHRYPLDYGEAPLVDQAMRLAAGRNIYRSDLSSPPYTISNYPPLYVAALIPFVNLFGPNFWAGRLLSTLCAWASAVFLALIVHTHTRDRLAAVITGLIFFAIPYVTYWSGFLRIDLLALALSLAALWVLARWPRARSRLIIAGLLLVAAIGTRQSYALAAPLAAFVWLLAHDWRRAIGLAAWVGGLALVLFLILNLVTRGGFYFNIVTANVNEFGMDRLESNLTRLQAAALPLLYIGGASLVLIRRWNPLWPLAAPYAIGAVLSALTIGKVGSNVNYFLELCAALSLAAGVVVAWSRARLKVHILHAALLVLLTWQTWHLTQTLFKEFVGDLNQRRENVSQLRDLETLLAKADGPVLADEYMGLLTLQGLPLYIQPFEVTQLAQAGVWDQAPLLASIQNKEFAYIVIYERPWSKARWTPEMLAAIQHTYTLTRVLGENQVYQVFIRQTSSGIKTCPGAPWPWPSSGELGVQWKGGGLDFFGEGNEGKVPVYAVADGLVTRLPAWTDAVAIQHDDPLRPGQKVWSYYGGLSAANGLNSYVAPDFPLGAAGLPVKAGQLLGYQGTWSEKPLWGMWMHVRFAVVRAAEQGAFPDQLGPDNTLDPSAYLGLSLKPEAQAPNSQPLSCQP